MNSNFNRIEECIILSAGLGLRLRPLTEVYPKPIIPLCNSSPLEINLKKIANFLNNCKFYINYHYMPDIFEKKLDEFKKKYSLISVYEEKLRDTGGGIENFKKYIKGDFLLHNADILTDIDLNLLIKTLYEDEKNLAVLALIKYKGKNNVLIEKGNIKDFLSESNDSEGYCYTGISVYRKDILEYFTNEIEYSVKDVFKKIIKDGEYQIRGLIINNYSFSYWHDIGTIEEYCEIHRKVYNKEINLYNGCDFYKTIIPKNIKLGNNCWIGKDIIFENKKEIYLENVIIWDNNYISGSKSNKIIYGKGEIDIEYKSNK